ncbi:hypothetical protein Goklo_017637, partial [Gossypium klotzschianum]|nr:hypothetical protein [Gossypium klotzschianum]
RPKLQVLQSIYNGKKGIGFTEHGPYWRNVRKLCNQQLFNASKIESFAPSRKEVLTHFIESLKEAAVAKEVVNIKFLKELIEELTNMAGAFNLADFVPFLGAFDLQELCLCVTTLHINVHTTTYVNAH